MNLRRDKNHLVRILIDEDGDTVENPKWHLAIHIGDSPRTVCTGEVFGEGEGMAIFDEKFVSRGGITCSACIAIIKHFKKVKF